MMARRDLFRWLVFGSALVMLAGCGSKGAVSVSAQLSDVTLEIVPGRLVSELRGEFDLELELGGSAPESTDIQVQTFSVVRGETTLVDNLDVTAAPAFPLELPPGERVVVRVNITEGVTVDTSTASALCVEPVRIRGVIIDSTSERPTPVESLPVQVLCHDGP